MTENDEFNSSEIEFEEPTSRFATAGRKTISAIVEHQLQDRKSSKIASKTLNFTTAAPGTQANHQIWLNKWDGWHKLQRSPCEVPTCDEILRFI